MNTHEEWSSSEQGERKVRVQIQTYRRDRSGVGAGERERTRKLKRVDLFTFLRALDFAPIATQHVRPTKYLRMRISSAERPSTRGTWNVEPSSKVSQNVSVPKANVVDRVL